MGTSTLLHANMLLPAAYMMPSVQAIPSVSHGLPCSIASFSNMSLSMHLKLACASLSSAKQPGGRFLLE